jgi:hypothetical protein
MRKCADVKMWNRDELSLDSTLWNIESTLNVTYGEASYAMEATVVDSSFVEVAVVNGLVSFDEVEAAYNTFYQNVKTQYDGVANDDKQFIYAHAEEVETGLKTATSTVKLTAVVGEGPINLFVFGANDNWYYGLGFIGYGGYCSGQYAGSNVNSDAAMEIARKIRIRKAIPSGNYSYINPVNIDINPTYYQNPEDPIPGDNIRDFLMFRQVSNIPNYSECIGYEDMNFYLNGTEEVVYNLAKPSSTSFIDISLTGDYLWIPPNVIVHYGVVTYGTLIVNPNPPEPIK